MQVDHWFGSLGQAALLVGTFAAYHLCCTYLYHGLHALTVLEMHTTFAMCITALAVADNLQGSAYILIYTVAPFAVTDCA